MAHYSLKWRLDVIDTNKLQETSDTVISTIDVQTFFTLSDVWEHLGCKLKRERCGYAGTKGNLFYVVTRCA